MLSLINPNVNQPGDGNKEEKIQVENILDMRRAKYEINKPFVTEYYVKWKNSEV